MNSQSTIGASHGEWFWEGNVQARLAEHLQREGWTVMHASNTAQRAQGIDLLLEQGGRRLIVEVKGYPSSVYERGPKQGQSKPTNPPNQARQWFSHALLSAMSYYGTTPDEVAVAFPDFGTYRKLLEKTRDPLLRLGIGVYFVSETGTIERVLDHLRDLSPT
jgi:hypothetical protein